MSRPAFRNDPHDFLTEALGGLVAALPVTWHDSGFVSVAEPPEQVGVISGGGSGHEPLHTGFVGGGMLTAACPGLIFTSPNAVQITAATRWADSGRGVVHIVKNYTGDVMNFRVARDTVAADGIDTGVVLVDDDVATDPTKSTESTDGPGRRGTGATAFVEKICGAAAARGDDLAAVVEVGRRVAAGSRSLAVALGSGRLPTTGVDTFDLDEGSLELGAGIHGEPGIDRMAVTDAAAIVERLLDEVCSSLGLGSGERVALLVNGLGATHDLELALVLGQALEQLARRSITVERAVLGTVVTALDTPGCSITLTRVDDELLELFDAPTSAPAWPRSIAVRPEYSPARTTFDDAMPTGAEIPWLTRFVERVMADLDALTDLDRTAGDGDFGTNMEAALGEVETPLGGEEWAVMAALADRFLVRAGGTSGAVFGTLFRELARAFDESSGTEALAVGLERAGDAIGDLGGAKVGDRTMLDALVPAAQAARQAAQSGTSLEEALTSVHEAAVEGARSTRDLTAQKGRASYRGDAAKGVPDPGAIVVARLFGDDDGVEDF
ncbi:MAG: dihydroxyacetone kinase family protein [Mobilicoccus sp.]|nr:dihydroxyacetone kinase family protein [Mobilicoccus sp.]